jgi:hypothetical protein
VEEALREEGRRIVVLIDDMDRLEQSEIRQVFKLVKLTGDFEYVSYVLAFDPDMVAKALGEAYGTGTAKEGEGFLEKIVQVPLALPAADPAELEEFFFDHVNEALRVAQVQLPAEYRQEFEMEFNRHLAPVLDTPRAAIRYANALAFIMPLLAGEVNPLDVMLLEALKIFYPPLHAAIRKSPESFTGSSRARGQGEREKAKQWMQTLLCGNPVDSLITRLFPLVRDVMRDGRFGSGDEVEWSRRQKVASREYLRRYLAYAVPRSDIADRRIDELIVQFETLTQEQASDQFRALVAGVHPTRLLWKLRVRVKEMDDKLASRVALVIASNGDGIPGPTEMLSLGSPRSSAAFLIRLLLARVEDPSSRLATALGVLAATTPLTFAQQCLHSMRAQHDGMDVVLQDTSELEALLAERIAEFARGASLWKSFPTGIDWLILLLHWQKNRGSGELHAYYRRALKSDAQEGVALVRSQLGLSIPGPFTTISSWSITSNSPPWRILTIFTEHSSDLMGRRSHREMLNSSGNSKRFTSDCRKHQLRRMRARRRENEVCAYESGPDHSDLEKLLDVAPAMENGQPARASSRAGKRSGKSRPDRTSPARPSSLCANDPSRGSRQDK